MLGLPDGFTEGLLRSTEVDGALNMRFEVAHADQIQENLFLSQQEDLWRSVQPPSLSNHMARVIPDRVAGRREELKLSQAQLGELAGVTQQAIQQLEDGKIARPRKLREIAHALKVSPDWLLGIIDTKNESGTSFSEQRNPEAVPIDLFPVKLKGLVEAGVWREAIELLEEDQRTYLFRRRPNFDGFERMALEIHGESMNRYYPPGTVVDTIKLAYAPRDIEIIDGDHVVVQRVRHGLYETTIKEFRDGALWPCSTDPRHQDPIRPGETDDEVQIVALVLEASQQRPNLDDR